jgi:cytochrome c
MEMRLTVGLQMLLASLAMASVAPSQADAAAGDVWSLSRNNVNVRSSPGLNGDIVATINPGETIVEVNVINEWYLVTLPARNLQGWIYAPLLDEPKGKTVAAPEPQTLLAPTFEEPTAREPAPRAADAQLPQPEANSLRGQGSFRREEPARTTAALDGGNPKKGEEVFYKCGGCHTTVAGVHAAGPSLVDVFGSRPGSAGGYGYSEGMRAFAADGHVWNAATLDHFIRRPARVVKGTSMPFSGIRDPEDRRDLIAYLQELSR